MWSGGTKRNNAWKEASLPQACQGGRGECIAKANMEGDFPNGPVVHTLSFHCSGRGSHPWSCRGKRMERRRVGGKEAREKAQGEKRREGGGGKEEKDRGNRKEGSGQKQRAGPGLA